MILIFDEEVIKERLDILFDEVVVLRYVIVVKGYLKGYLVWNCKNVERILGRIVLYFFIFEYYFKEYGLFDDFKYLVVVELVLKFCVIFRVGVGGLW